MIAIARIKSPHGVHGFCKVSPYNTEKPGRFMDIVRVKLSFPQKHKTFDNRQKLYEERAVEAVRGFGSLFLFKFADIDSPEAVRRYSGCELLTDEGHAAPLDDGEYYYNHLQGCRLLDNGLSVGVVTAIIEGGGGELLEVKKESGKRILMPFKNHFIGRIDTDEKNIELRPDFSERWLLD